MISVAVMAHPKRRRDVEKLLPRLGGPAVVVWDQRNSVWDTGRRSLLAYDPKASHHLVIQDDAMIRRDLAATCQRIIAHVPPDVPVSLYMGRWRYRPRRYAMSQVVDAGRATGASFAVFGGPWWGVGIMLPTSDIEAVVAYGDENPKNEPNYDLRIAQFYAGKGIDCWYTLPSIVEHRGGPSLVGRKGQRRHAAWFSEGSLADLSWNGGALAAAEVLPRFPRTP